jgi:hypothetical protein
MRDRAADKPESTMEGCKRGLHGRWHNYEIFDTDTYSGVSDVKFNKWLLWGSVTGTDTRAVYGGDQITEKEWHFELDIATEGEYKAVIPD